MEMNLTDRANFSTEIGDLIARYSDKLSDQQVIGLVSVVSEITGIDVQTLFEYSMFGTMPELDPRDLEFIKAEIAKL